MPETPHLGGILNRSLNHLIKLKRSNCKIRHSHRVVRLQDLTALWGMSCIKGLWRGGEGKEKGQDQESSIPAVRRGMDGTQIPCANGNIFQVERAAAVHPSASVQE